MASSFTPSQALRRRLLESDGVRDILEQTASDGADEARAIARSEAYDSGSYHDSIDHVVGKGRVGWAARVLARDFKAHWIEFGTERQPARAVLRRAVDRLNVRFVGRR